MIRGFRGTVTPKIVVVFLFLMGFFATSGWKVALSVAVVSIALVLVTHKKRASPWDDEDRRV